MVLAIIFRIFIGRGGLGLRLKELAGLLIEVWLFSSIDIVGDVTVTPSVVEKLIVVDI